MMQMQQQQRRMGPQAETGPKRGPPGANLYVSNLPFTVSERELWDLFSPFGQILEVKLIEDRATGRSRGFGISIFIFCFFLNILFSILLYFYFYSSIFSFSFFLFFFFSFFFLLDYQFIKQIF